MGRFFDGLVFIALLTALATSPITGLLALGYLLSVSARIAREGSIVSALSSEIAEAARFGRVAIGMWLVLLPLRLIGTLVKSATVIHEGSDLLLTIAFVALTIILLLHVVAACLAGGQLRHFLVPRPLVLVHALRSPKEAWARARDGLWEALVRLRVLDRLWLGARGALGTFAWLALPVTLLVVGSRFARPALGITGAVLLVPVLLHLPFAQTHFAYEDRLSAMFEVKFLRVLFQRAPLASCLAVASTLLLAAPLFVLKIEHPPRELLPYVGVLFVVLVLPARVITGWAYGRSRQRTTPCHVASRVLSRLVTIPIAAAYVVLLYLTQFTSWNGTASLYEQHAFLMPAPFLQ